MDFSSPDVWLSLLTLSALEIVLGVDNIIFISILAGKLPAEQRNRARKLGLGGAFVTRLLLLGAISWIVRLDQPLFTVLGIDFSGKSLILLGGGLFLLFKATREIHHKLEGSDAEGSPAVSAAGSTLGAVVVQMMLLDIVFSIDSIITAVGMTSYLPVMVAANVVALLVMLVSVHAIGAFVERHPTVKVLALSFLMMIGLVLVADGLGFHIPKGYVYFAMGFSVVVEALNIQVAKRSKPVKLHTPTVDQMKD
jgi:predicted tellurium resistance membrane protein TerC